MLQDIALKSLPVHIESESEEGWYDNKGQKGFISLGMQVSLVFSSLVLKSSFIYSN